MDRKTSAEIIRLLRKRYGEVKPALDYRSVYELCIAVVLSAQTTDRQVNLVTPELFRLYPDATALAKAPVAKLERIVQSTGFFRMKAKHISQLAKTVAEKFGGEIPSNRASLESLPGVAANPPTSYCRRGSAFRRWPWTRMSDGSLAASATPSLRIRSSSNGISVRSYQRRTGLKRIFC